MYGRETDAEACVSIEKIAITVSGFFVVGLLVSIREPACLKRPQLMKEDKCNRKNYFLSEFIVGP